MISYLKTNHYMIAYKTEIDYFNDILKKKNNGVRTKE